MDQKLTGIIRTTYELLEFFPDTDPLKAKAKEKVLAILDGLVRLDSGPVDGNAGRNGDAEKIRAELLVHVEILEQYLELGKSQGFLGGFNLLILLKEYRALKERMAKKSLPAPALPAPPRPHSQEPGLTARQGRILKILEKEGQAQVADFLKEIPHVTKRTLRRDLDDLLKKGRVERVGEWNHVSYKIGQR